jgi:phosphoenolpyruvate carboxylase
LGDTIRTQEGQEIFDVVEHVRKTSVEFRRYRNDRVQKTLEDLLNNLSREQTVEVVRAFSFFSHLANIAEDQHGLRLGGESAAEGVDDRATIAGALRRARTVGITVAAIRNFLGRAQVAPVLTAHPTEVRRKSILDREIEIARLLADRDRKDVTANDWPRTTRLFFGRC